MQHFVVYLTLYKGDKLPPWYIGSTFEENILKGYNGSIRSKKWIKHYKYEFKKQ